MCCGINLQLGYVWNLLDTDNDVYHRPSLTEPEAHAFPSWRRQNLDFVEWADNLAGPAFHASFIRNDQFPIFPVVVVDRTYKGAGFEAAFCALARVHDQMVIFVDVESIKEKPLFQFHGAIPLVV